MGNFEVKIGSEGFQELAESLMRMIEEQLEESLSSMMSERIREAAATSGVWVPRMLKLDQVAEILQVPPSKARQMTASGDIPRLNLSSDPNGKTIRVDPRDLLAWLDAHQEFPARRDELKRWMEANGRLAETPA